MNLTSLRSDISDQTDVIHLSFKNYMTIKSIHMISYLDSALSMEKNTTENMQKEAFHLRHCQSCNISFSICKFVIKYLPTSPP